MEYFEGKPVDYMGDGVYVVFDGYGIELRANDHKNPTDTIYLEPEVFKNLVNFDKKMKEYKNEI